MSEKKRTQSLHVPNNPELEAMTLEKLEERSRLLGWWGAHNADDQGWKAQMEEKDEIDEEIRRRKATTQGD